MGFKMKKEIALTPDELMRFVGRKNIFAIQTKNGYVPIRREITKQDLINHLNGAKTYGSYLIREDGKITFAVIDIDGDPKNLPALESLGRVVINLFPEFERVLEFSGRRGYHIWLFPTNPEPPSFVRELVKTRLREYGIKVEVYPKQDMVNELNKQLGSLVKLPCGIHNKTGKWSKILKWIK